MPATLRERLLAWPFYILPQHAISWLMYQLARVRFVPVKNLVIRIYSRLHAVNMQEAVIEDKFAYESLNAFFTRALKPECRPLDATPESWICPVDGSVSQAGDIQQGRIFQAKGCDYSLLELLGGDTERAAAFSNGHFATLYLSPRDYHRIHMPLAGELEQMRYIPGRLFSVATHTVNAIPRLFARNERAVCHFNTAQGPMALVLVGAINVSAMETVWHGLIRSNGRIQQFDYRQKNIQLQRGEEMGRFNLGSTVIVLGGENMGWDTAIAAGKEVKLGQRLAVRTKMAISAR
jgi:phosphatidylserine decarboxylase